LLNDFNLILIIIEGSKGFKNSANYSMQPENKSPMNHYSMIVSPDLGGGYLVKLIKIRGPLVRVLFSLKTNDIPTIDSLIFRFEKETSLIAS
jgi:hypothetical protein